MASGESRCLFHAQREVLLLYPVKQGFPAGGAGEYQKIDIIGLGSMFRLVCIRM